MAENPFEITLGDRTYQLREQRIGRIGRKLGKVMQLVAVASTGEAPTDIGPQLHETLKIFIDDLDPIWKLAGYPSAEAYDEVQRYPERVQEAAKQYAREHLEKPEYDAEAYPEGPPEWEPKFEDLPPEVQIKFEPPEFVDTYEEAADKSPTPGQLIHAVEAIFALHGGDRVIRLLKNFISPETIRAQIKMMQMQAARRQAMEARSHLSPSAPPGNGASGLTSSTMPGPTSELATLHSA